MDDPEANLRYLQALLLEPTQPMLYAQYATYLRAHGEGQHAELFDSKAAEVLEQTDAVVVEDPVTAQ